MKSLMHSTWILAGLLGVGLSAMGPGASAAKTRQSGAVNLDVALGQPVILGNRGPQTAYLKVGLTGTERPTETRRSALNVSLVLDRSSSMNGAKIERAKEAAIMVIDRLGPNDIVSVVSYDDRVDVLVPATKVTNKEEIRNRLRGLTPRGSTALFAGVSRGIEEVRKFLDRERVNRVILLSDGQANVGPSSPNELGRLGASARKQGISITTVGLGLGYNEDLMVQLAKKSDGNHSFVEKASELAGLFDLELGDLLSVVAQELTLKVNIAEGVRPVRVLNRDAEIHGQQVVVHLNQIYARQERYFLIELQVPTTPATPRDRPVAEVALSYADMVSGLTQRARAGVGVRFTDSESVVAKSENRDVMVQAVEAIAVRNSRAAVTLRDKGDLVGAEKALKENVGYLEAASKKYDSKKLGRYRQANETAVGNLKAGKWNKQRKVMRKDQHAIENQATH